MKNFTLMLLACFAMTITARAQAFDWVGDYKGVTAIKEGAEPGVKTVVFGVENVIPNESNNISSLKKIEITFNDDVRATDILLPEDQFPIYKNGGGVFPIAMGDWAINGKKLTITFRNEITDAGTYTLKVAKNIFERVSDGEKFAGIEYQFTISSASGIYGIDSDNEKQYIYNLTGEKVEKTTVPGIYIVNGKKVLVK
ncbi:MAG: Ig-like domain-containing protein [Bacteroidaceae bacterium]|nr:Ig-like domain-containing protein [Bacteroidaceae bacterium]